MPERVKKKEFRHTSLEDNQSVVRYLQALTQGLQQGQLRIGAADDEVLLEPRGLLQLDLRISQKPDAAQIRLHLSWKVDDGAEPGSLRIESSES